MSSCVSAALIHIACSKHLSSRQLTHKYSLHYITWRLILDPQNKGIPEFKLLKKDNFIIKGSISPTLLKEKRSTSEIKESESFTFAKNLHSSNCIIQQP